MTRWQRLLHRHSWTLQIGRTRICLYCPDCDTTTAGWDVTPREEDDDERPEEGRRGTRPDPADRR